MPMKNPPHPGEGLHMLCLKPLGLSITQAAAALGISRKHLSNIIHGQASISLDMAIRISKAFGGTADSWLRKQINYDLAHADERAKAINVKRFIPKEPLEAAE